MDENKNPTLSAPNADPDSKLRISLAAADACIENTPTEDKVEKFTPLFAVVIATLHRVALQRGRLTPEQIMDLVLVVGHCDRQLPPLILAAVKEGIDRVDERIGQSAVVN